MNKCTESASDHLEDKEFIDYANGLLPTSDASKLERHLAACPSCSKEMEGLIEIVCTIEDPGIKRNLDAAAEGSLLALEHDNASGWRRRPLLRPFLRLKPMFDIAAAVAVALVISVPPFVLGRLEGERRAHSNLALANQSRSTADGLSALSAWEPTAHLSERRPLRIDSSILHQPPSATMAESWKCLPFGNQIAWAEPEIENLPGR